MAYDTVPDSSRDSPSIIELRNFFDDPHEVGNTIITVIGEYFTDLNAPAYQKAMTDLASRTNIVVTFGLIAAETAREYQETGEIDCAALFGKVISVAAGLIASGVAAFALASAPAWVAAAAAVIAGAAI